MKEHPRLAEKQHEAKRCGSHVVRPVKERENRPVLEARPGQNWAGVSAEKNREFRKSPQPSLRLPRHQGPANRNLAHPGNLRKLKKADLIQRAKRNSTAAVARFPALFGSGFF